MTGNAELAADRRPKARECVLSWATPAGHLEPLHLGDIVERIASYSCDSLPGSAISRISYDGTRLEITLGES